MADDGAPAGCSRCDVRLLWPLVTGVATRLYLLPDQMLVDDEWHLVHRLRDDGTLWTLVTRFGSNDHSIGYGIVCWLVSRVLPLNEILLRLPSVIAGCLLVFLVPMLWRRFVGADAAVVLAWLLAVSPMLCFFSRLARPYATTTLLSSLAVVAWYRWHTSRGADRRAGTVYALAAGVAPLFHVAASTAVIAPAVSLVLPRRSTDGCDAPPAARLAAPIAAASGLAFAALALPLWYGSGELVARLVTDRPTVDTARGTLELLAGVTQPAVLIGVLALGVLGVLATCRRDRFLASYLGAVIAIHAAAIALSGATALHVPIVAARYVAVVLPSALVFPAVAVARIVNAARSRPPYLGATTVGGVLAALLLACGPLPWIYRWPNDFTNHASYQADYRPERYFERFRPRVISPFYATLARLPPGSVTVVEAPWYYYFHSYAYYQRMHRQHVLIGFVGGDHAPTRIGELRRGERNLVLTNAVSLGDDDALRRRHVDLVILHRDVLAETPLPTGVTDASVDMGPWVAHFTETLGAPIYSDGQISVFALQARARAAIDGANTAGRPGSASRTVDGRRRRRASSCPRAWVSAVSSLRAHEGLPARKQRH